VKSVRGECGRWLLCSLLVATLAAATARAQPQPYAGYVLEVRGTWVGGRGTPLSKGSRLRAGERVYVQSPTPDDFIVIVNKQGGVMERRRCGVAGECAQSISVRQDAPPRPSGVKVVADSVFKLLFGESLVVRAIRSRADGDLLDGIAELKNGRVDLSPAFRNLPAATYYLTLQRVGRGASTKASSPRPSKVRWGPGAAATLPGRGLRPGLYEVALYAPAVGGGYIPRGVNAWVLVSPPPTFTKADAAHREARALADSWGEPVTAESRRDFLRAHLAHLAGLDTAVR
jgi:hypothetical protein